MILLVVMVVSIQSGCSLMHRGNQDRSNIVSNENGSGKTSNLIENTVADTKDTPSQEGKQVDSIDNFEDEKQSTENNLKGEDKIVEEDTTTEIEKKEEKVVEPQGDSSENKSTKQDQSKKEKKNAIHVISQPEAITVLVNKQNKLPDNYAPNDLVYPNVRFIFSGNPDKKKMRQEAARALEEMFAGAKMDGILLAGASGYRSQATQKTLYNSYVKRDGKAAADRYSAYPGHSEHQTGLAMDISGINGKCAAMDCFGESPEAKWLARHSHEYGFIVRYPKGKEQITGYQYEPWHMRYVGTEIATEIFENDFTLEEYFNIAIPVSGKE